MLDFNTLDVARYEGLFSHLLGVEIELSLVDQSGVLHTDLISYDDADSAELKKEWSNLLYQTRRLRSPNDEAVWVTPIVLGAEEKVFWLRLQTRKSFEHFTKMLEGNLKTMLSDIAHCLADDFHQHSAISAMSNELAARYEEVNLVYALDEIWQNSEKYQENEAIEQILSESTQYTSNDGVVLIIPENQLELSYCKAEEKGFDETLTLLRTNIYPLMTAEPRSLVQNRDEWSEKHPESDDIPYQLVISKIENHNQQMIGILVFFNHLSRPHYTNTDRRLCELLAREISKIYQSKRDPLTGLVNRSSFEVSLNKLVKNPIEGHYHSLIYFDIDRFQIVNDNWGHAEGDRLLRQVSALVRNKLNKDVLAARLGGDEFGIILENVAGEEAVAVAEKLRRGIQELYFMSHGQVFEVSCSFGVAEIDPDFSDIIDVLTAADVACHLVKEKGKNAVRLYQPNDKELIAHHDQIIWASRIKSSLDDEQFELFAQAITPLSDPYGKPNHYEILVRLRDENGNIVSPGVFIPAAERYNLMPLLDRWVLKTTLEQLRKFNNEDSQRKVSVSINISGQSLSEDSFLQYAYSEISKSGIDTHRICLEITETAAVGNLDQALKFIETLREIGCLFALDDFGSGMSSFGYLKNLPVDYLKLDGIFIKDITQNEVDQVMVKSIHYVAQAMGLKTIAEYVEDESVLIAVRELGIDYAQGYGIDKPGLFLDKLDVNVADRLGV